MAHMVGVFRIGNEPQLRYSQAGDPLLNLSLACNYGRKGEDGKRPTQWYDCVLFGDRAEKLAKYLNKGDQIFVTLTNVHQESFQRRDGSSDKKLSAVIGEIELIGGNGGQQQQQQRQHSDSGYARESGRGDPPSPPRRQESRPAPCPDDLDDDIPW